MHSKRIPASEVEAESVIRLHFNGGKILNLRFFLIIAVLSLLNHRLDCQTLDLDFIHSSGPYRGTAGSAIGATETVSSLDKNPGGLTGISPACLSFSQSAQYYSYSLYRHNQGVGAVNLDWNRIRYNLEHILFASPVKKNIVLGMGLVKKTNTYLYNYKRAITWSSLFNQETTGSIYALAFSSGFSMNRMLSLGITVYRYFGAIASAINGENHGTDEDKWAIATNRFDGWNCRIGAVIRSTKCQIGLILEPSGQLDVQAKKESSTNRLYASYFPDYDRTKWKMPLILGAGVMVKGTRWLTFTFDFENRHYENSNVRFNLFEFGGRPNWKDENLFRLGVDMSSFSSHEPFLRLGYAYLPQLYASNNSKGEGNNIIEYTNTKQNVKHLFTIGKTIKLNKWIVHIAFEESIVTWHRNLSTRWFIEDDYTEKNVILSTEWIYSFK